MNNNGYLIVFSVKKNSATLIPFGRCPMRQETRSFCQIQSSKNLHDGVKFNCAIIVAVIT